MLVGTNCPILKNKLLMCFNYMKYGMKNDMLYFLYYGNLQGGGDPLLTRIHVSL